MYPAAQNIQEVMAADDCKLSDNESKFIELVLWYDDFRNEERFECLKWDMDDVKVLVTKMNEARADKDYKTSDYIRDVLKRAGHDQLAKNK